MTFASEKNLVDKFVRLLAANRTPWGEVRYTREFDYARGKTDVVAMEESGAIIAIEAKLKNWKCALHQAYRNTCFAHRSFVLLPKTTALSALGFVAEFEERGVGLCYIDGTELVVLRDSPHTAPIEPWLACEAISRLGQQ
jgi:hypothetical protein